MVPRHRIAWKSRLSDYSGHGEWHDATVDLDVAIRLANKAFPDILHWIETEPSWTEADTSCEDTEIVQ